jgi:phosphatidate phosphatase APP1
MRWAALKIGVESPRRKVEKALCVIGLKTQVVAGIEKWYR